MTTVSVNVNELLQMVIDVSSQNYNGNIYPSLMQEIK